MENEPGKWTDQQWSIPGNWFRLIRRQDTWCIESEAGFHIAINPTDAERAVGELNDFARREWEREKQERERGE